MGSCSRADERIVDSAAGHAQAGQLSIRHDAQAARLEQRLRASL